VDRYIALIDGAAGGYGIVFPDLPGCTAMGNTIDEAIGNAANVLRIWVAMTEEQGASVPRPSRLEDLRGDVDVVEALGEGATLATIPLIRDAGRPVKANLSLDAGVLAAIDAAAARRKLTRSAFIEAMARETIPKMV
jgi:predicted RNase H-like HicB family nuclease